MPIRVGRATTKAAGMRARLAFSLALASTGGAAVGCSSDDGDRPARAPLNAHDGDPRDGVTRPGGAGDVLDTGDARLQIAAFGLDARPSNTTCLAPARPPNAAPVTLAAVYADVFTGDATVRVQTPMIMAQRPSDGSRWFLAQRDGRIVSFNASGAVRDLRNVVTVAQLNALTGKIVTLADESGFHGMAFDPSFASNGRLYVSFATTCDGEVPICDDPLNIKGDYYRYAEEIGYLTSPDGGASFTSYTRLLHVGRWSQMHYSGSLAFGKDGLLYITSGDGLDDSAAQFNSNLFGKVLRIDVHGPNAPGKPYGIPPTNPFAAGGGRPEIFAWGLRNPFRMSIDRVTGDLWLGDVGQDSWEEVNRVEIGANLGWPCREGKHPAYAWNDTTKCPSKLGLTDPIVDHAHAPIGGSVTGGYVYRGSAIAGFQGTYVYGDFIEKALRGLTLQNGTWTSKLLNGAGPRDGYVSFAEDSAGEIYAVALFDEKIHKLVASAPPAPSTFPERLSATGCFLAGDVTKPAAGVIPYDVNAALWSDGADKERWLAIPDHTTIVVRPDGDFDLPIGSVLAKTFSLGGKRVETRLLVRHSDGDWAGYSYEWNASQTDATLLPSGKVKAVGAQRWSFPSRSECDLCHTRAAGRSLGLELGQLNRAQIYPETHRISNQLQTLDHIGLFSMSLGDPATLIAYASPGGDAPLEARARAYLHANCSGCHRPNGGGGRSPMDLRHQTPLVLTAACDRVPIVNDYGSSATRLIKPGVPAQSIISLRMHSTGLERMPPIAKSRRDPLGTWLVDSWIESLAGCP
ncbi:MAG: PQQ-dependent sugar dehydrogenase [Labilithrix sp.]|nr:PQQ-dependent sugar dehydrogenase [Labilithrix sp.]